MRHLDILLLLLLLLESEACTFSDADYHAIEKLQNFTSWSDSRAECSSKCTVECCTDPVGGFSLIHYVSASNDRFEIFEIDQAPCSLLMKKFENAQILTRQSV